jgi:hypothetical protein
MMIHNNIIPFQCSICKKRFREKANCNYHMKKHIPQFKKICKKISTGKETNTKISQNSSKNDLVFETKSNEICTNENDNCKKVMDCNFNDINNNNNKFTNNNNLKENKNMDNILGNNQKVLFKCKYYDLSNLSNDINEKINLINLNNPFMNIDFDLNFNDDSSSLNSEKDSYLDQNNFSLNNEICEKDKNEKDFYSNIFPNNILFNNNSHQKANENNFLFNEPKRFYDCYNFEDNKDNNDTNYILNNDDEFHINNIFNCNKYEFIVNNDFVFDSKMKNKICDDYYSNELENFSIRI